ncbi:MAG: hypothetical protein Q8928_01805 [Bacteroidota bacterium]|nr:hypothetical protein [Bacteroidota bacterium]
MKIAFPLRSKSELASDFAHSPIIGIYDDSTGKTETFKLAEIERSIGLHCFLDVMTSQGLKMVVSPFYSYMSLRVFKENNIETLKAIGKSMEDNIEMVKNKKLQPFDAMESLMVGECAGSCGSCGSKCS